MVPSTEHLSNYLSHKHITISNVDQSISFNGQTCLAVICYAIKFGSNLSDVVRRLNDLASERAKALYRGLTEITKVMDREISELFVNSFAPEMQRFFKVPKVQQLLHEDESTKENEVLAGFLDFLLQVLNSEANIDSHKEQRYALLQKELTFLLSVLGDIPFRSTDLEEVKNLLAEFGSVANEAGKIIYSCAFATSPVKFYTLSNTLFEKVDLLYVLIKEHCCEFSEQPRCTSPRTDAAVDSLFIVDSFLQDLENVMEFQSNLNMDSMNVQIKSLHQELTSSRSFLEDIKLPQNKCTNEVKEFIIKIRDVAYEAEYLINSHVVGNVPQWYLNLRLPAIIQKTKVIGTRLQETKKIHDNKVLGVAKDFSREASLQKSQPTVVVDNFVEVSEDNRTKILDDLVGGPEELKIISIFGMPGVGKTTIANKLYNDRSILDHFDLHAWCVVSQEFQMRKVLIDILRGISRKQEENKILDMEDEGLGLKIYQNLKGRRYFIIMDDVWYENTWIQLRRYFPDDVNGSRIMLTSRIKDSAPSNSIFHQIHLMSEFQCWKLLEMKVFHKEPCPPQLQDTGKRIAEKCNGLPLAIVVIAGVLATLENEESAWKEVERNLDKYIFDDPNSCMKILELSYEHLPNHLKLCFLYLAIYPEDSEIPTQKLIWLWIAEGFLKKEKQQSMEYVAEQYLLDLINRSLLLIAKMRSDGGIKACRIHDLLRDMCLRKAHEEYFLKSINDNSSIYEQHHRLRLIDTKASIYWRPFGLHCRSFSGRLKDPSSRFTQMPLLRVMDLLPTENVLYEIKRVYLMVHLRYLGIERMPNSIVGNFSNLEFLCIKSQFRDINVEIPSFILKMAKLRHLQIKPRGGFEFEEEFDVKCQKSNMESLSYVCINNQRDEEILSCSPHLRKLKFICNGELFPDLNPFTKLASLKLVLEKQFNGELAKINFPSTTKKLTLSKTGLPWEMMSIVGILRNLNILKLLDDAFVGEEWKTKEGEFQELKFLKLDGIKLNHWVTENEHFPKLQSLVLDRCWDTQLEIPSELGNITTLQRLEVRFCSNRINESAALIEQEQLEYGNEELKVIYSDVFKR